MNMMKSLIELELRRIEGNTPFAGRKGLTSFILILLFLAGSLYFFRNQPNVGALFMGWVVFSFGLALYMSLFEMMSLMSQPYREWWLSLPYSRKTLLYAKFLAYWNGVARICSILVVVPIVQYVIAVQIGIMISIPWVDFIILVVLNGLLVICTTPLAISMGFAVTLFYKGWIRWLFILPYFGVMIIPFSFVGTLSSWNDIPLHYFSPSYYLIYMVAVIFIGWPLTYLLLQIMAKKGMRNMTDVRIQIKNEWKSRKKSLPKSNLHQNMKSNSFMVLHQFEQSRYQYYLSLIPIRIVIYIVIVGFAIGSFFTSNLQESVGLIPISMLFPLVIMNIVSLFINNSTPKLNLTQWWLSFPHQRNILVLSRITALWVTGLKYMLALWSAIFIGTMSKMIWVSWDVQLLNQYIFWSLYSILFYAIVSGITLGLLQIIYLLMRSRILALLIIPITLFVIYQPYLIAEYFYPSSLEGLIEQPNWSLIGYIAIIGIPIAWLCLNQGAKNLHHALGLVHIYQKNREG